MNKSEKFWDKMADRYDLEEQKDAETYRKLIKKIKQYLKKSDMVLDYGCGTGLISNEISGNVKTVHAVDISSKMIGIAKKKADGLKLENIFFSQTDIFDDTYKKESFDVIMVFYILHLLEDSQGVIKRIHELLKPGGMIISATPCLGEKIFPGIILSLLGRVGLVPEIKSYKISELEGVIAEINFEIIEAEKLNKNKIEYFIAARKK